MKILYVEDNKINAVVMQKILDTHQLEIAYTGPDGILAANTSGFDLVLLDINLGSEEMDGCDVLRCLRNLEPYKTKPIFAITAYALPQDEERFLNEGFDDYFSKPVNYEKLQSKIAQIQEVHGLMDF